MPEARFNFDAAIDAAEAGARAGVVAGCQFLLSKSDERIPHETGYLQGTGDFDVDATSEGGAQGTVFYDTVYARRQHEELDWQHDAGRTAKYLENPAIENAKKIGEIIGAAFKGKMA